MPLMQFWSETVHGMSAHPLYAQSLFVEQGYACASFIKPVVTRHARSAAANPMLGIREAVGALYRRDCCSGREREAGRLAGWQAGRLAGWQAGRLAANGGGQRRCRRAKFLCRELLALWSLSVQRFETLRSDHAAPMLCGCGVGDKTCARTSGVKTRPLTGRNRCITYSQGNGTTSALSIPGTRAGHSRLPAVIFDSRLPGWPSRGSFQRS